MANGHNDGSWSPTKPGGPYILPSPQVGAMEKEVQQRRGFTSLPHVLIFMSRSCFGVNEAYTRMAVYFGPQALGDEV